MKDRKRLWDSKNIDKLSDEVEKFFENNIKRFKSDKDKPSKKRKRCQDSESTPAVVVDSTQENTVTVQLELEDSVEQSSLKRQKI
jgi:hypothetical protein